MAGCATCRWRPDTPLLWVIREQVGLTGTKYGCGVAQCGACTVHINGEVHALLLDARRRREADRPHRHHRGPVANTLASGAAGLGGARRAAMRLLPVRPDHGGGGAAAKNPRPTDKDIDEAMTNICRCGTYQRIRAAVHMAAGNAGGAVAAPQTQIQSSEGDQP